MKKLVILAALAIFATGCSSMKRDIIDPAAGKVVAHEEFSGDAIGMVSYNLQDKIVFDFVNGTFIYFKIEPPSKESPTGVIKISYENGEVAHLSIPKDCKFATTDGAAKMIEASTGKSVSVTTTGIETK